MILLDESDVDALASIDLALTAARDAAQMVARGSLTTGRVQVANETTWARVLAGLLPDADLLGYKEFHRVGKRVRYHISLFEQSTGDMIALVDGRRVTSLRTAATAALAAAHFFGDEPISLGVIGSGEEAKEGLRASAGALNVKGVRVFSPTAANREAFARELGDELSLPIEPVASTADAFTVADAAYVATSASGPPSIAASDVRGLRFVAAIGSTRPDQRELHGDVLAEAGLVVIDCADAAHEAGDSREAAERYGWDPARAVLLGKYLSRRPEASSTPVVFKSVGSVEQDLTLAHRLVRVAKEAGRGRREEPVGSLRVMR